MSASDKKRKAKAAVDEIASLRARAEAAEKERDEARADRDDYRRSMNALSELAQGHKHSEQLLLDERAALIAAFSEAKAEAEGLKKDLAFNDSRQEGVMANGRSMYLQRIRTQILLDAEREAHEKAKLEVGRLGALADTTKWDDKPTKWDAEIDKSFPTRTGRHDVYATALEMVGAKRSKGELVDLVNWLLAGKEDAEYLHADATAELMEERAALSAEREAHSKTREALDGAEKALSIAFDHLPDDFDEEDETYSWLESRLHLARSALRPTEPPASPPWSGCVATHNTTANGVPTWPPASVKHAAGCDGDCGLGYSSAPASPPEWEPRKPCPETECDFAANHDGPHGLVLRYATDDDLRRFSQPEGSALTTKEQEQSTHEGLKCPPGEVAVGTAQNEKVAKKSAPEAGWQGPPVLTVTAETSAGAGTGGRVGRAPPPMPEPGGTGALQVACGKRNGGHVCVRELGHPGSHESEDRGWWFEGVFSMEEIEVAFAWAELRADESPEDESHYEVFKESFFDELQGRALEEKGRT